ncbi:MAG: hypothetical protein WCK89_25340, partial [bacterium]
EAKAAEAFQPLADTPSVSTAQADVALPGPAADFKPVQPTAPTAAAHGVAVSLVADAAPAAETPAPREPAAAKLPELPEIRLPMPDVALKVEKAPGTVSEAKADEAFQPLADTLSVSTSRADVALPGPVLDFKPVQRTTVQTVAAGGTTASLVGESSPSAQLPATRVSPAAKMPDLPEIQPTMPDVALKVETPLGAAGGVAVAEAFQPLADKPSVSISRVDIALPGSEPVRTSAGVSDVTRTAPAARASSLLTQDAGGAVAAASGSREVSTGITELREPGTRLSALLADSGVKNTTLNLPGKLDVPGGLARQISPYKLRQEARKNVAYVEGLGGSGATQGSVTKALDWLTKHQEPDGHWDIQKYGGEPGRDIGATGLALLCYLGWGVKHNESGQYQPSAQKAVTWLIKQAKPDGDIRGGADGDMYDQGIATIALAEAFALTKDKALRPVVSNLVQFIVKAQNAGTGGWRYRPGQAGDTSVCGWQLMAVLSARMGGFAVPEETIAGADRWLTSVSSGEHGGLYGYEDKIPMNAMVAEGMFCRQIMGVPPEDPRMMETAAFLSARLPNAAQADIYYWYYGTLAMYQHRGLAWEKWNEQLKTVLPP